MSLYQRSDFLDTMHRFKTLSLFLESAYDINALYTLNDEDKLYKGKLFPSLKKLYLQMGDLAEYEFANTHLAGWEQWRRIKANKELNTHVEEWRDELERKVTSENMARIRALAEGGNYNAAKFLANKEYAGTKTKDQKANAKKPRIPNSEDLSADTAAILQFTKREGING